MNGCHILYKYIHIIRKKAEYPYYNTREHIKFLINLLIYSIGNNLGMKNIKYLFASIILWHLKLNVFYQ